MDIGGNIMESNELENLIKLRDTIQENLSSPIFSDDKEFLKMYHETDNKINQEKIESIGL